MVELDLMTSRTRHPRHILLPLRKMEKILMLPRRSVVKVRPAGVVLRACGRFAVATGWASTDRSTRRTLPLSWASCPGLWTSFLFRVGTRDIMATILMSQYHLMLVLGWSNNAGQTLGIQPIPSQGSKWSNGSGNPY